MSINATKAIFVMIYLIVAGILIGMIQNTLYENEKEHLRCKNNGGEIIKDSHGNYICALLKRV